MRPTVATLPAPIRAVVASADGYAVLTTAGIVLLDATLAERGRIEGDHTDQHLVEIAGLRFALHADRWSALWIGGVAQPLAKVELGKDRLQAFVPTPFGFLAVLYDGVLVDVSGRRSTVVLPKYLDHGGAAWNRGAVVAGHDGLAILDARGEVLARTAHALTRTPTGLPTLGWIAVPAYEVVALFDADAKHVGDVPVAVINDRVVAFATGMLVRDPEAHVVTYWELGAFASGDPIAAWRLPSAKVLQPPVVIGERVVVADYERTATIVDRQGAILATLDVGGMPADISAFAGGIAIRGREAPGVTWWRPDGTVTLLPHDVTAGGAVAVPAGLVTFEGRELLLWRTDVDGPVRPRVACAYPLGTPIVIGSQLLRVEHAGHTSLRAVTLTEERPRAVAITPGTPWRPVTTREDAEVLVGRLARRELETPPVAISELAFALGTSPRALLAAIRARKVRLVPPQPTPGYDYLGTFTTSGKLTISDPCYAAKADAHGLLALRVEAADGLWHVFVGPGRSELAAVHDSGFAYPAAECVANLGVDSGTMGIYDKAFPRASYAPESHSDDDQVIAGLGVIAGTGGDGAFPVFVARRGAGPVVKIRIVFAGDQPEVDGLLAKLPENVATKTYAASATFVVGDTLAHVKFGIGHVVRVGGDKKIDVRFPDGIRTLVHARS